MFKVIDVNTIVGNKSIGYRIESIGMGIGLFNAGYAHFEFEAFANDDIVTGRNLDEYPYTNEYYTDWLEHKFQETNESEYDGGSCKTFEEWLIECRNLGMTPFFFVNLDYGLSGYEIVKSSRTNLKSDIYVGQDVWFAYANDIHQGKIIQVMLAKNGDACERESYSTTFLRSLVADGCGLDGDALGSDISRINRYLHAEETFIDSLKHGYVVIRPTSSIDHSYLTRKEVKYIIRPLDKVYTKSPF